MAKKKLVGKRSGKGGTLPFYTGTEFDKKVFEYLKECKQSRALPNIAGICVFLDLGRTQFYEYAKKYPNTIKRARAFIENEWVDRLGAANATGAIFYLKNAFRKLYKDRHETDITSGGKPINISFDGTFNSSLGAKESNKK